MGLVCHFTSFWKLKMNYLSNEIVWTLHQCWSTHILDVCLVSHHMWTVQQSALIDKLMLLIKIWHYSFSWCFLSVSSTKSYRWWKCCNFFFQDVQWSNSFKTRCYLVGFCWNYFFFLANYISKALGICMFAVWTFFFLLLLFFFFWYQVFYLNCAVVSRAGKLAFL